MQDVLNEGNTSETAPFVVQGDEVPPVYQKVAASPKSASPEFVRILSTTELSLPSGWVMTSHEIEGSKLVILLTHQNIKKILVHPNIHLYSFVLYLQNQFEKYRDSTNILEEIL